MPNYLSKLVLNGVEYVLRAAASVTGVKGDNESDFRTGDVNITKDNIGLGNVGNYKAVSTNANQGLSNTEKSNARSNIGAGTSNFSGNYSDLSNQPTLGTASAKDVPSSGNASTSQVVMGNDTRLSDSRNAKDVSSWAKASTKPTYTYSEVGAAAASHNQASNTITSMTGYSKASSAGSIATTDSLNTALGKLEKTLDGKTSNTGTVTSVAAGTGLSGGTITTSGTISLASGVVTAGSAGPTAAVTGNDGATIAVPRITVDTYGRVTGLTSYNLTNKNTTYSAATQSAQGLMSAADKQKLDSLTKVPSGRYHLTFGKST